MASLNKFLGEIEKNRKKVIFAGRRKKFWEENKANFEQNVKTIVRALISPKKWKVYFATGNFLSEKQILPYDYDKWSGVFLVGATKGQGFEIMVFLNKASLEFLSLPALIPLIIHEAEHIKQIVRSPRKSFNGRFNDAFARHQEIEAERAVRRLPQKFVDEAALESILYCFDKGGWGMAQKMADFLYKKQPEAYGGGYDRGMTKEQHQLFLRSKKARNIRMFIAQF
jgi:hypothetical protein